MGRSAPTTEEVTPPRDIAGAKDPVLRASFAALCRAAELARQTAIRTNTHLVIVKDGRLTRIPADVLRASMAEKES